MLNLNKLNMPTKSKKYFRLPDELYESGSEKLLLEANYNQWLQGKDYWEKKIYKKKEDIVKQYLLAKKAQAKNGIEFDEETDLPDILGKSFNATTESVKGKLPDFFDDDNLEAYLQRSIIKSNEF